MTPGAGPAFAQPLGTAFTYQGDLRNAGTPSNGLHDMRFRLYDAITVGAQVGSTICANNVSVAAGRFTVPLDFGAQFAGSQRFLEIEVRTDTGLDCTNVTGFTMLSPRQALTAAPYSLFALNAANAVIATTATSATTATNATQLNGQAAAFYQNASNLNAGTLGSAMLSGAYSNLLTLSNAGNSFTGSSFTGSGAGLTTLNATNITTGTIANARTTGTSANTANTLVLRDGAGSFSAGTITGTFSGSGAALTTLNASNLTTGIVPDLRLSGAYSSAMTFSNAANSFTGNFSGGGAALTSLNAANITTGTLADARLSGNVALLNTAQTFSAGKTFSAAPAFTAAGSPFSVTSTTLVANLNADRLDGLNSTAFLQSIPSPLTLSGTSDTHIIRGENTSAVPNATGVFGQATAASGTTYGVYGQSDSTSGRGVVGFAGTFTGTTYGVFGQSNSASGRGVFGEATAGSGTTYGGRFESDSTSGRGVFGFAGANTGTIYGVLGSASTAAAGYAVFASGDMAASGTKPFRIDHPDDPENKYLLHYAAESPEVINFYRGTVVLNGAGEAIVDLPHYFAKVNKSPSYQLTAVGAAMPNLHVMEEIDETSLSIGAQTEPGQVAMPCWFRIAGGAPGMKVSWRVEAVRNDRWVQQRGAPVEIEKQDLERGTYQHPELYGMPAEKGMNYDATRAAREETPALFDETPR